MQRFVSQFKSFFTSNKESLLTMVLFGMAILAFSGDVQAQVMPWEGFAKTFACSLTGPWVKWLAVAAIALGGIMFGLGELSGPFQKVMQIAGGFTAAVGASTIAAYLLGASGAGAVC